MFQRGRNCQLPKGSQNESGKLEIGWNTCILLFFNTYSTSFFGWTYIQALFLLEKSKRHQNVGIFPQPKSLPSKLRQKIRDSNPNTTQNPSRLLVLPGFNGQLEMSEFYPTFFRFSQVGGWWTSFWAAPKLQSPKLSKIFRQMVMIWFPKNPSNISIWFRLCIQKLPPKMTQKSARSSSFSL